MNATDNTSPNKSPASAPGGTLGTIGPFLLLEKVPGYNTITQYLARQKGPFGFERLCWVRATHIPAPGSDTRSAEALQWEAQVVSSLDHPSIIRAYDFHEEGNQLVFSFEVFSRLSLSRLQQLAHNAGKKVPDVALWTIAHSIFSALSHAHDERKQHGIIVHGDIKPTRVLVRGDGSVRLGGFGSHRAGGQDEITAVGMVAERPSYVAPEQVKGERADQRTDLFSAALILWEMLTGQSATPDQLGDFELLQQLSLRKVESLRTLRPDLPALVTTALDLCLSPDREDRTIGADEVAGCILSAMPLESSRIALVEFVESLGPAAARLALDKTSGRRVSDGPARRPKPPKHHVSSEDATVTLNIAPRPQPGEPNHAQQIEDQWLGSDAITLAQPVKVPASQVVIKSSSSVEREESESHRLPPEGSPNATPENDSRQQQEGIGETTPQSPGVQVHDSPSSSPAASSTQQALDQIPETTATDFKSRGGSKKWWIAISIAVGIVATAAVAKVLSSENSPNEPSPVQEVPSSALAFSESPSDKTDPSQTDESDHAVQVPRGAAMLLVKGPPDGWVFVQGVPVGPTGKYLPVACGPRARFVRVGRRPKNGAARSQITWLAPGRPMQMRCGKRYTIPARVTK